MNRAEIESSNALVTDADTSHEDSRGWYDSYGWHFTTENAGDVCLQAVEYDWLDGSDAAAVRKLRAADSDITSDEAEAIVERAREIREAAESICGLLDEAVEAYESGDLDRCRRALLAAYSEESDHGDAPAAQSLAGELLAIVEEDNVRRPIG